MNNSFLQEENFLTLNPDLFTHTSTIFQLSLSYVQEVLWVITQSNLRLGLKDMCFSFYEKNLNNYSFQTFEQDMQSWKFKYLRNYQWIYDLSKTLIGIGPKPVFRQILHLFDQILQKKECGLTDAKIIDILSSQVENENLNRSYCYLRMSKECLGNLCQDEQYDAVQERMKKAWKPFITILLYTLTQVKNENSQNKYESILSEDLNLDESNQSFLFKVMEEIQKMTKDSIVSESDKWQCENSSISMLSREKSFHENSFNIESFSVEYASEPVHSNPNFYNLGTP